MLDLLTRKSHPYCAALLALALVAGLPLLSSAANVFQSGFEEGSKAIWDDYDGNPDETNLLMADPGPFNKAGNHVMRLRAPAGRGGADLVKVLPSAHDRLSSVGFRNGKTDTTSAHRIMAAASTPEIATPLAGRITAQTEAIISILTSNL